MNNFTCQGGIYEGVTGNLNVLGEVQVMYDFRQCMEYPGNSKLSAQQGSVSFMYCSLEVVTTPRKSG